MSLAGITPAAGSINETKKAQGERNCRQEIIITKGEAESWNPERDEGRKRKSRTSSDREEEEEDITQRQFRQLLLSHTHKETHAHTHSA